MHEPGLEHLLPNQNMHEPGLEQSVISCGTYAALSSSFDAPASVVSSSSYKYKESDNSEHDETESSSMQARK